MNYLGSVGLGAAVLSVILSICAAAPAQDARCPAIKDGDVGICAEMCELGKACEDGRICCKTGCGGTTCVDLPTAPAQDARCPAVKDGEVGTCGEICELGKTCDDGRICCKTGCGGTTCVDPPMCGPVCEIACLYGYVLDKNGCRTCACNKCPAVPQMKPEICSRIRFASDCNDHSDCKGNACCPNECDVPMCIKPPVKVGECPRFDLDCVPSDNGCKSDSECPGTEKCCAVDCTGQKCVQPPSVCELGLPVKSGPSDLCEALFERWYYDSATGYCKSFTFSGCNDDGIRFATELECRKTCNATAPKKAGQCPQPTDDTTFCPKDCEGDYGCPDTEKCCTMGCHVRCEKPQFSSKCPVITATDCLEKDEDRCFTDSDCPGQSCCPTACGGTKCT